MQTTIRELIKQALLKKCLTITKKLRDKYEKKNKKRKFTVDQQYEIEYKMKAAGWSGENLQRMFDIFSILVDAPELKAGTMIPHDFFSIVVLEANASNSHAYVVGVPHISTHDRDTYLLNIQDGVPNNWRYQITDKPRLATDTEVESCINFLNEKQWKTIMTSDLFKPFIEEVMNTAVMIDDPHSNSEGGEGGNGSGNDEIELADGRTISV